MIMEGGPKYSEEHQSLGHFINFTSYMDWPEIKFWPLL
jgi:hypothetical protein